MNFKFIQQELIYPFVPQLSPTDTTPYLLMFEVGNSQVNSLSVPIETLTGNKYVYAFYVSTDNTPPAPDAEGWTTTPPPEFTFN